MGHLQPSELQTARDLCGPGSSAACRAASVPTQELGENSCFGSSSSWDHPWLSRLWAEFELPPPQHAQVPKGSMVRAAQVSGAQPDRRNSCGTGKGTEHMLRPSAVHWFHLALLAQPGKTQLKHPTVFPIAPGQPQQQQHSTKGWAGALQLHSTAGQQGQGEQAHQGSASLNTAPGGTHSIRLQPFPGQKTRCRCLLWQSRRHFQGTVSQVSDNASTKLEGATMEL